MGGMWERKKKREDGIPQFPWELKFPYSSFEVASLCPTPSMDDISHISTWFHSHATASTSQYRPVGTSTSNRAQSMNRHYQAA